MTKRITEDALINELQRVAEESGRLRPRVKDMNNIGAYSGSTYRNQFGSWDNALDAADLDTTHPNAVNEEDALDALHDLAEDLNRTPSYEEMESDGRYSPGVYERLFGKWSVAVEAADLSPLDRSQKRISKKELLDEVHRLAEANGGDPPIIQQLNEEGDYSPPTYYDRFGDWRGTLIAAGFDMPLRYTDVSREEMLKELREVADHVGKTPQREEFRDYSDYKPGWYTKEFGSWKDAVEEAGLEPNRVASVSREDLLAELERLGEKLSRAPRIKDVDEHGRYSPGPYHSTFNSFGEALELAGFNPNRRAETPREALVEEVRRLVEARGEVPTVEEFGEDSDYSLYSVYQTFGSWSELAHEAGYGTRFETDPQPNEIPRKRLIEALYQLHDKLGRTPTAADMAKRGEYGVGSYQREFGTWNNALRVCEFEVNCPIDIPPNVLETDLQRVVNELGRTPTREEYVAEGRFSVEPFKRAFGSWNAALRACGHEVIKRERISEEELLGELRRVAEQVDGSPTAEQMKRRGQIYPTVYNKRFGSWNAALDSAGLEPNIELNISDEELKRNFEEMVEEIESVPLAAEVSEVGRYSLAPYWRRFGTWTDAVVHYGYEPRYPGDSDVQYYGPNWATQRQRCLNRDSAECVVCGLGRTSHYVEYDCDLHVHHIQKFRHEYEKGGYQHANRLENLVTVCAGCHRKVEGNPPKYFKEVSGS